MFYKYVCKNIWRLTRNFNSDNDKSKDKSHSICKRSQPMNENNRTSRLQWNLNAIICDSKLNWTWDMNSLRIRDAPGPENGYQPCSNKEGSSRTMRCVGNQQWTPELQIIGLMQYRTSAGLTIDMKNQYLPRREEKTHKELNINISQIFPIEVGCAKVCYT